MRIGLRNNKAQEEDCEWGPESGVRIGLRERIGGKNQEELGHD